jgi:hypothetical protein
MIYHSLDVGKMVNNGLNNPHDYDLIIFFTSSTVNPS